MLSNDLFENVPNDGLATLHHALGALDVLGHLGLDETLHDKRLEEFKRHHLGQTTLVQLELWAHHDDRTARVVHALAEQVLTEPALLTLQHVRETLQWSATLSSDWTSTTSVVEECVDSFLEHALFVVDNDVGRAEVEQSLQTVVAVDDATVQVVEVRRRETSTVELHHWSKVRRNDRHCFKDHRTRVVQTVAVIIATVEGLHDGETLQELGVALRAERLATVLRVDHLAHDLFLVVEVHPVNQLENCVGSHAAFEVVTVAKVHLAVQDFVFDDLT